MECHRQQTFNTMVHGMDTFCANTLTDFTQISTFHIECRFDFSICVHMSTDATIYSNITEWNIMGFVWDTVILNQ